MDAYEFRNNAFAGPDAYCIGGGSCGSASMVAWHLAILSMAGIYLDDLVAFSPLFY